MIIDVAGFYTDHNHDDRYDTSDEVDAKIVNASTAGPAGPAGTDGTNGVDATTPRRRTMWSGSHRPAATTPRFPVPSPPREPHAH